MNYNHIIWDWNGTIFNDATLCCNIMNDVLSELGHPTISFEFYKENLCHPMIDFYRMVAPQTTDQEWLQFTTRFHDLYAERRLECNLHNSSEDVLRLFKDRGSTQSILSAHPQDYLEFIVDHFK